MTAAVPFYAPDVGDDEVAAVTAALRSGWLANGSRTASFEDRVAALVEAPSAVATTSGTSGLLVALQAVGAGPGDEVITSPVTCIASVNAVVAVGAKPVLVDVRPDTLTLDPDRVAEAVTSRTIAVMPVHYAGHPGDVDAIAAIAARHGLAVIDDAAHALGARYKGRPIGSTADLTVFSFSATKIITTGDGGMVVGRSELVDAARTYANLGADQRTTEPTPERPRSWADIVVPGLKLAMCDVAASIGLAQLARLQFFLARRRQIAARYTRLLADVPGLQPPVTLPGVEPAWHMYTLRITPETLGVDRDEFLHRVVAAGGTAAKQFKPVQHEPYVRDRLGDLANQLPIAERELRRNLSLPMYPGLTDADVDTVVSAVVRTVDRCLTRRRGARAE